MADMFTKRIWQTYICQSNELKREIKQKNGEANGGPSKNLEEPWPTQPLLRIAADQNVSMIPRLHLFSVETMILQTVAQPE